MAQGVKVRALALASDELPELHVKGEEGFVPLNFRSDQPSEVVLALGGSPLPLHRKELNDEGELSYPVDRTLKLPTGARGVLILGWKAVNKLRLVAIDDDFGGAGFNDWLLINTGQRPIAFSVGKGSKPIVIRPGTSENHRIGAQRGKGVEILAQAPFDGKTKTFYSTYWPVHPNKRAIVLFIDDGRKIRVKRISDKVAP